MVKQWRIQDGAQQARAPVNLDRLYNFFKSSFVSERFEIRPRQHERASLELPGPLGGTWNPNIRNFALRTRNARHCLQLAFCAPSI